MAWPKAKFKGPKAFGRWKDRAETPRHREGNRDEEYHMMEFKCVFKKNFGRTEKVSGRRALLRLDLRSLHANNSHNARPVAIRTVESSQFGHAIRRTPWEPNGG